MTDEPKGPRKIDLQEILADESDVDAGSDEFEIIDADDPASAARPAPPPPAAPAAGSDEEEPDAEERILRLRADFDNYRKRMQREMEDFRVRAGENLVADLLPVLDNLDRALTDSSGGADDPFRQGVELIRQQLLEVLSGAGLRQVEAVGEPFDPEVHEAVTRQATDELPPNMVIEELQKGYKFHGRLLRPAMVKVTFRPETAGEAAGGSGERPDEAG